MGSDYSGKVATADQMRRFDAEAIGEFGVPGLVLMENAGRLVFEAVCDLLGPVSGRLVSVVAGRGNNGGDGFVAARHLRGAGALVRVFLLGDADDVKGDAGVNLNIIRTNGLMVESVKSAEEMKSALADSNVVLDAIFGTGLKGDIEGLAADAIMEINGCGQPVVAVDLPSGLDADTGRILGVCVEADCTVTFGLPKLGHFMYPGASYVGSLRVGEIGIPHVIFDEADIEVAGADWVIDHLPARPFDANKGIFGTTLIIAGSSGFTGAAILASEAALRSGAGLSVLALPVSLQDVAAAKLTEVMTRGLPENAGRAIGAKALMPALELAQKASSVVLGCGLGTDKETCEFVGQFVRSVRTPLTLDADGLNCLTEDLGALEGDHGEIVITPHPGEMARLLGTTPAEVQSNRLAAAREAAARFNCVVTLKGARTVTADPSGKVFINLTGNSGMATAGTGDVLSGVIGGLISQRVSVLDAAVCGVYIHGRAGDIAASSVGEVGMIASDVLTGVPFAFKDLCEFDDE